MRIRGTATKYPGVQMLGKSRFRIRVKVIDLRTGRTKEVDRLMEGVSAQEAARVRAQLLEEARMAATPSAARLRVGDFAKSWLRSKALKIDGGTARTYVDALENHVLPALGDFYYDALKTADVQAWVDRMLSATRTMEDGTEKAYSVASVHGWYRVLRTMTRDAMEPLRLERDPTLRVAFPPAPEREERNSLTAEQLARFLGEMQQRYPQHFALTVMLAYTGLRFCHASALRWDDVDESAGLLRVVRKQVHGKVGAVTRKKRAPAEIPIEPEVAAILKAHRQLMIEEQAPGLEQGWMFPSDVGTLRQPSSLYKAWRACATAIGVRGRFTVHGLRYTFNDLTRRAGVSGVVTRAITGHVTEQMTSHYSTIGLDEKRAAVASVIHLVKVGTNPKIPTRAPKSGDAGGDEGQVGTHTSERTFVTRGSN